jgi:peptide methionine sulfoxide reductase MsrA
LRLRSIMPPMKCAAKIIRELTAEKAFSDPIVTAVEPAQTFYPARVEKFRKKFTRG